MFLNIIVSLAAWFRNPLRPPNWEDPGWGRRIGSIAAALIGGLGSVYLVDRLGSTNNGSELISAIAAYAGSTVLSGIADVMLNPQPIPPGR